MVPSPSFWSRTRPNHGYPSLCLIQSITFTPSLQRCCLEKHLASKGMRETREATCPPASLEQLQCLWPPSGTGGTWGTAGPDPHPTARGLLPAHPCWQHGAVCWPGARAHSCASRSAEPGASGCSPGAAACGKEPDSAPGPAPAGIGAGSWGAARCSQQSGEPLGDSPNPPATGQGPLLPVLSPQGLLPSLLATGAAGDETQARLGDSQGEQRMPARCSLRAWPGRPSSPLLRAAPLSL